MQFSHIFPAGEVVYCFGSDLESLDKLIRGRKAVLVTDSNLSAIYDDLFRLYPTIIIPAGEERKTLETVKWITEQLIELATDRGTLLIGVGGGVVTDITGFAASIYMRGISFGFLPTSLLGMVDASIGGKNGVDLGVYKNMIGSINQPEFVFYHIDFLQTLPEQEWSNGLAEAIKYGCIYDKGLFDELSAKNLDEYKSDLMLTQALIHRCVEWKNKAVLEDEREQGNRKLLNFGHTVGHAIENQLGIAHGQAISIGMIVACVVSESVTGLHVDVRCALERLLQRYQLPIRLSFDAQETMRILKMDKKRSNNEIDFIVLEHIGRARIERLSFDIIEEALNTYLDAGDR